jgi:hypothetical protein
MKVSTQFHVSTALLPGTAPLYPLYSKLSRPQGQSGRCGEKFFIPAENQTPITEGSSP